MTFYALSSKNIYTLENAKTENAETHMKLNVHDYDLNLLWANVGGYIGIILGYNLAQFPQIIGLIYGSWKSGDLVLKNNLM